MLKPLKEWLCDNCGKVIKSPEDGYVIWRTNDEHQEYDFRIIHQDICDNKSYPSSMALDEFLGPKGLVYLTSFLSIGKVMNNLGRNSRSRIKNLDEFVDLLRRVQVPYYEEARKKFSEEHILEDMSDANEVSPYQENTLKRIIKESYD